MAKRSKVTFNYNGGNTKFWSVKMKYELIQLDKVSKALEEATTVVEIKGIEDKLAAIETYAKQTKQELELQNKIAEKRLETQRKGGVFVGDIEKESGKRTDLTSSTPSTRLQSIELTRDERSNWQRLTGLSDDEFKDYKDEAITYGELTTWKVHNLIKKKIRKHKIKKIREAIEKGEMDLPKGKFEVIVIDPPWEYGREYDGESSRVASPYPEMSIAKLENLYIPTTDDSVLWLWTTHNFIWNAKELLELRGFEYKAILVWNKEKLGMGSWLRMQCEFCLLGIKGKPKWNLTNERDIIIEARKQHSRKPEGFYQMVEKLCIGRRLDYFGREQRKGWTIFGVESTKFNNNNSPNK